MVRDYLNTSSLLGGGGFRFGDGDFFKIKNCVCVAIDVVDVVIAIGNGCNSGRLVGRSPSVFGHDAMMIMYSVVVCDQLP